LRSLRSDLREENATLRAQVIALESERAKLAGAADEVTALRTTLAIRKSAPIPSTVARVLGSESGSGRDLVVIDRGERDDIAVGDPALTANGFLYGTIAEVKSDTSIVLLLTDDTSRIAASVYEHPATIGVVEGGFGLVVRFGLIPLEADLEPGNIINTSAGGTHIPSGIPIGRIGEVRNDAHAPFKSATIKAFESLETATHLIILHQ